MGNVFKKNSENHGLKIAIDGIVILITKKLFFFVSDI